MNQISILFFATLRDLTGARKIIKSVPTNLSISGLKELLVADYPSLRVIMNSVIVAMDHEFAFDEAMIVANAEIALFPPVSGG